MDFVELIIRRRACSPNTVFAAVTSIGSPAGVEVPCALMYSTSSNAIPASWSARFIARAAPSPSTQGAVMW